ncbi:MAG: deoxyribodipyrimidine photo-lyase [Pseudomonadota bacterium]
MTDIASTSLVWFRRDLRLSDHPALFAAAAKGPVIPVFILDPETEQLGAAPRWRLEQSLKSLAADLDALGMKLTLRKGPALSVLRELIAETGAGAVHWSRLYDPTSKARDTEAKAALKGDGVHAESHYGHLLWEPWVGQTKTGGFFKVYTPYWKSMHSRDVPECLPVPKLTAPVAWPNSLSLSELNLSHDMLRGGDLLARHGIIGASAAQDRLDWFLSNAIGAYDTARDATDQDATSGLSENFTTGEISVRQAWHAGKRAWEEGAAGAEVFCKELVWREFAWHLMHHTPHIATENWRPEWNGFPWQGETEAAERWKRGMTGVPMVDAGMRQMYVTGKMHNRVRMLVASYLTKHLLVDWRVGMTWFDDCLTDWDPASNAMGWQWTAGSGPDASPYFRIFNPESQAEKFDKLGNYRHRWLAETYSEPHVDALSYFDAVPRAWGLSPDQPYPKQIIDLKAGRERALEAYQTHRKAAA